MKAKYLPSVHGLELSIDDARKRFEAYGAALARLEPLKLQEAAKVRLRMDAEVLGVGRFLSRNYWRWWWIAYGPKVVLNGARETGGETRG